MIRVLSFLLPILLLAQSGFEFREIQPGRHQLSENGAPVYVYNASPQLANGAPADKRRCCYLHPVYAPNGVVMTDDFPKDHWHHRGIFWAWPIVEIDGRKYDPWLVQGIHQHSRGVTTSVEGGMAVLAAENEWRRDGRAVVTERMRVETLPVQSKSRRLRFTLVFEAVESPVTLRGEPADQKGYGGFNVRFAPRDSTVLTTSRGKEAEDSNMVPLPWAQLEGNFGGRRAGLRIDIDPGNAGYPNGWCLRHYGFLGVNFPGLDGYRLQPGHPLTLRYTVTLNSLD